jgi:hypothetical protein
MKLIDDWKKALRLFSVQANGIGIAISSTYALLYEQLKESFPAKYMAGLTGLVFLFGILGRLVHQGKKEDDKPEDDSGE